MIEAKCTALTQRPAECCSLMMNTRCGDIDPAIVVYLAEHCGMTVREVDDLMNKQVTALQVAPQLWSPCTSVCQCACHKGAQAHERAALFLRSDPWCALF